MALIEVPDNILKEVENLIKDKGANNAPDNKDIDTLIANKGTYDYIEYWGDTIIAKRNWQSSPDHPQTFLAYITVAEAKLLRSLGLGYSEIRGKYQQHYDKNKIPSFNGWGEGDADPGGSFGGLGDGTSSEGESEGSGSGGDGDRDYSGYGVDYGPGTDYATEADYANRDTSPESTYSWYDDPQNIINNAKITAQTFGLDEQDYVQRMMDIYAGTSDVSSLGDFNDLSKLYNLDTVSYTPELELGAMLSMDTPSFGDFRNLERMMDYVNSIQDTKIGQELRSSLMSTNNSKTNYSITNDMFGNLNHTVTITQVNSLGGYDVMSYDGGGMITTGDEMNQYSTNMKGELISHNTAVALGNSHTFSYDTHYWSGNNSEFGFASEIAADLAEYFGASTQTVKGIAAAAEVISVFFNSLIPSIQVLSAASSIMKVNKTIGMLSTVGSLLSIYDELNNLSLMFTSKSLYDSLDLTGSYYEPSLGGMFSSFGSGDSEIYELGNTVVNDLGEEASLFLMGSNMGSSDMAMLPPVKVPTQFIKPNLNQENNMQSQQAVFIDYRGGLSEVLAPNLIGANEGSIFSNININKGTMINHKIGTETNDIAVNKYNMYLPNGYLFSSQYKFNSVKLGNFIYMTVETEQAVLVNWYEPNSVMIKESGGIYTIYFILPEYQETIDNLTIEDFPYYKKDLGLIFDIGNLRNFDGPDKWYGIEVSTKQLGSTDVLYDTDNRVVYDRDNNCSKIYYNGVILNTNPCESAIYTDNKVFSKGEIRYSDSDYIYYELLIHNIIKDINKVLQLDYQSLQRDCTIYDLVPVSLDVPSTTPTILDSLVSKAIVNIDVVDDDSPADTNDNVKVGDIIQVYYGSELVKSSIALVEEDIEEAIVEIVLDEYYPEDDSDLFSYRIFRNEDIIVPETNDIIIENESELEQELWEEYTYAYTYYDSDSSFESAPVFSNSFLKKTQAITIQDITYSTTSTVDYIRVYRIGGYSSSYRLITEIENDISGGTTEYVDSCSEEYIPTLLDTQNLSVVEDLKGLIEHKGTLFAYKNNQVYFSRPGKANMWSSFNSIRVGGTVSGIASAPLGTLIFTENSQTYLLGGTDKYNFTLSTLSKNIGCISNRSISNYKNTCIWLDYEGLMMSVGSSVNNITKEKVNLSDIGDIVESMVYDNVYYLVGANYTLAIDFRYNTPSFQKLDNFEHMLYNKGKIYVQVNDTWYEDAFVNIGEELTMHYKAPMFIGNSYDILTEFNKINLTYKGDFTYKVYIDETEVLSNSISSEKITVEEIKIPSESNEGLGLELELIGAGEIRAFRYIFSNVNIN